MPVGPIDLDPREVLEHLNDLGYSNITPAQLKAFVKDLKKLIYYDLSKQEKTKICHETLARPATHCGIPGGTGQKPCTCPRTIYKDTGTSTSPCLRRFNNNECQTSLKCLNDSLNRLVEMPKNNYDFCKASAEPFRCNRIPTHYPDENQQPLLSCNESSNTCGSVDVQDIPPRCTGPGPGISEHQMRQELAVRRDCLPSKPSSFIRPQGKIKSNKCDPVALYQFYQNKWSQFRLPGEDPHSNLRWRVRHKMMGAHSTTSAQEPSNRKVFRTIQP